MGLFAHRVEVEAPHESAQPLEAFAERRAGLDPARTYQDRRGGAHRTRTLPGAIGLVVVFVLLVVVLVIIVVEVV